MSTSISPTFSLFPFYPAQRMICTNSRWFLHHPLSLVAICDHDKTLAEDNLWRKELMWPTGDSPSLMGRNSRQELKKKPMDKWCLLACFFWFAQLPFLHSLGPLAPELDCPHCSSFPLSTLIIQELSRPIWGRQFLNWVPPSQVCQVHNQD